MKPNYTWIDIQILKLNWVIRYPAVLSQEPTFHRATGQFARGQFAQKNEIEKT